MCIETPKNAYSKAWGASPTCEEDIWRVFFNHLSGGRNENDVLVKRLPWSEQDLSSETEIVRDELTRVTRYGVLPLNSQPPVNGAPSSDPLVGWGPHDGFCYQKAYVEFFARRKLVDALLTILPRYGNRINYHILNKDVSVKLLLHLLYVLLTPFGVESKM